MTITKRILALLGLTGLFLLAGCGGGGGSAGSSLFGCKSSSATTCPGTGPTVAGLVVTLSSPTIPNSGSATVTATVTALDTNNNAVPGAQVTLAANNNGVVTIGGTLGSVTDSTGRLTATIGIGASTTLRTITLTATSGSASGTAALNVVTAASSNVPTSIDVIAASPTVGTAGDGVLITAFVKDVNNNALANATVAFTSSSGTLSSVGSKTDASGTATAVLSAGADRTNRNATVTVTSGSVSSQIVMPITGTTLKLSGPSSMVFGTSATFNVVAADSKGNVIPNLALTATSSLGNTIAAVNGAVTGSTGQVTYSYLASKGGNDTLTISGANASVTQAVSIAAINFSFVAPAPNTNVAVGTPQPVQVQLLPAPASPVTVTFSSSGGSLTSTTASTDGSGYAATTVSSDSAGPLTVQASVTLNGSTTTTTLPLSIVGTTPTKLVLQITPTALPPNIAGATTNQAQLLAKVTDASGNPVPGLTVNFTRVADPSQGNLQQISAVTNAAGQATVNYISGPLSTANNGVVLQASVASAPTVTGQASLTVNGAALFIALGTGNTIITSISPQVYEQDWVAYVTDANGIAVNAVTLTTKGIPAYYLTGQLGWNAVANVWDYVKPIYICRNEDANGNGILDPGEDDNGDGLLEPGNVIAVAPTNVQTNNGLATISLTYARSYAKWVQLNLTASATVAGTESKNTVLVPIVGAAPDYTNQQVSPPGQISPFGAFPKGSAIQNGNCVIYPLP